jgi:hypothetical protein
LYFPAAFLQVPLSKFKAVPQHGLNRQQIERRAPNVVPGLIVGILVSA